MLPTGGRGGRWKLAAAALGIVAAMLAATPGARATNPDALWKIVNGLCVPNQQQRGNPAPCALVDLHAGVAGGYVVLKDLVGQTQYLLMPTARVTGIEDPLLLRPGVANYFADAWAQRGYTERAAGRALPRDAVSLAVNSTYARSQNQLHIHIDCIRPDVRDALRRQRSAIGDHWTPLAEKLAGHRYWAMRVIADSLEAADPFKLLATGRAGARAAMGRQTLVVAGIEFADGRAGFILLNDRADLARHDRAGGEELQDHSCAIARE